MFWLALGYPLLAHLAVLFAAPRLQWLALSWLAAISMWDALCARRAWAWIALIAVSALFYWLVVAGHGLYALYVPPAAIPAALLVGFTRSLRPGAAPWVTRVATAMRGEPLPEPLIAYTRRVTLLWCGVFVAMIASAIGFAIWASPELWSLMTNVVHYLVLGAVFVVEFVYRRIRYGALEPWGLFEYLRRLISTNVKA
jgi:uncharacterized membrane protein